MKNLFNKFINLFSRCDIIKKDNPTGKDIYYVSKFNHIYTLPDLLLNFYLNIENNRRFILLNINLISLPTADQVEVLDNPNSKMEFNVVTNMPIDLDNDKLKFYSVFYLQDNVKILLNNKDFNPNIGTEIIFDYKFINEKEYFKQVDLFNNS